MVSQPIRLILVFHFFLRSFSIFFVFGPSVLRAPAEQTKVATILGIGPSVLRAPAEQTKVATVLGN